MSAETGAIDLSPKAVRGVFQAEWKARMYGEKAGEQARAKAREAVEGKPTGDAFLDKIQELVTKEQGIMARSREAYQNDRGLEAKLAALQAEADKSTQERVNLGRLLEDPHRLARGKAADLALLSRYNSGEITPLKPTKEMDDETKKARAKLVLDTKQAIVSVTTELGEIRGNHKNESFRPEEYRLEVYRQHETEKLAAGQEIMTILTQELPQAKTSADKKRFMAKACTFAQTFIAEQAGADRVWRDLAVLELQRWPDDREAIEEHLADRINARTEAESKIIGKDYTPLTAAELSQGAETLIAQHGAGFTRQDNKQVWEQLLGVTEEVVDGKVNYKVAAGSKMEKHLNAVSQAAELAHRLETALSDPNSVKYAASVLELAEQARVTQETVRATTQNMQEFAVIHQTNEHLTLLAQDKLTQNRVEAHKRTVERQEAAKKLVTDSKETAKVGARAVSETAKRTVQEARDRLFKPAGGFLRNLLHNIDVGIDSFVDRQVQLARQRQAEEEARRLQFEEENAEWLRRKRAKETTNPDSV